MEDLKKQGLQLFERELFLSQIFTDVNPFNASDPHAPSLLPLPLLLTKWHV